MVVVNPCLYVGQLLDWMISLPNIRDACSYLIVLAFGHKDAVISNTYNSSSRIPLSGTMNKVL